MQASRPGSPKTRDSHSSPRTVEDSHLAKFPRLFQLTHSHEPAKRVIPMAKRCCLRAEETRPAETTAERIKIMCHS